MDEFYFVRQKKDEDSKNFAIRFENGEWKKIMEKPIWVRFFFPR